MNLSSRARWRAVRLVAAVAVLGAAVSVASSRDAGATPPPTDAPQASLSLSLATPASLVGPFVATDANPAVDAATGTVTLAGSDLAFAPVDLAVPPQWQFSVSLVPVPDTDVSVFVNPMTGDASISGQFTMQLQTGNGNVNCQVGPFPVDATTQSPGAAVYSPASGQATVIDGDPTIPAVSNCGGAGGAINGALSLPMPAPQAQASAVPTTSSTSVPTDTPPVPAISLQLAISPPLQPPPTPPTATTPPTTARHTTPATDPPALHDPPASHSSSSGTAAPRRATAVHLRVARSTAPRTKAPSEKTQNVPATLGPAGFGPISGDQSTPRAEPPNLPKGNALASAPTVARSSSGGSSSRLPFVLVVGTAALAFALWLIGSDVRKGLVPARQSHAFRGMVVKPSRTASRRTSATPRKPR